MSIIFQIFEYIIGELRKLNTPIAFRLETAVEERFTERRLKEAATLLAYLRDPRFLEPSYPGYDDRVLDYSDKKEITKFAKDLYISAFYKGATPSAASQVDTEGGQNHPEGDPNHNEQEDGAPPPKRSRAKELAEKLDRNKRRSNENRGTMATPTAVSTSVLNAIKNDMKDFEVRGQRPTRLAEIYRALLSIPPTSVEAER